MAKRSKPGEFDIIRRFFAPLAAGAPGALGLVDDAAVLALDAGRRLVVTTDALIAGVHFLADEAPADTAARLLRVNLSDLAAMGARPFAYTLVAALPEAIDEAWLEDFAAALADEQATFGLTLVGGDTVATPGPLALILCALGSVAEGSELTRSGARAGDTIFVSGTIGDGALGLAVLKGGLGSLVAADREALAERFRRPRPRIDLGSRLTGLADAAIDVSDGLIADLGHLCEASRVGAVVRAADVPLSAAGRAAVTADPSLLATVLSGGDDYELLFTGPAAAADRVADLSRELELPLSAIGEIVEAAEAGRFGAAVRVLDAAGRAMRLGAGGYRHF